MDKHKRWENSCYIYIIFLIPVKILVYEKKQDNSTRCDHCTMMAEIFNIYLPEFVTEYNSQLILMLKVMIKQEINVSRV